MYIYIYIHTYIHTYIYIHTHTHTHMQNGIRPGFRHEGLGFRFGHEGLEFRFGRDNTRQTKPLTTTQTLYIIFIHTPNQFFFKPYIHNIYTHTKPNLCQHTPNKTFFFFFPRVRVHRPAPGRMFEDLGVLPVGRLEGLGIGFR